MKIDLIEINSKIVELKAREVTDSVYFDNGVNPRPEGLFSYDLFGNVGSPERRKRFGYIDLGTHFFNPVAYKAISDIETRTPDIISGNLYVRLDAKGDIVEDDEKGETGIKFFYDNWGKIKFRWTDSVQRQNKIKLLDQTPKEKVFMDKFLVIPAYYRDFNPNQTTGTMQDVDEINEMYSNLIRMVSTISDNSFSFINETTKFNIQRLLYDIYNKFTDGELARKKGLLQESLLGKNIDYATRSVISAPQINSETWEDIPVKFGELGIPLSQVLTLFYPFFVKYINDFIELHKSAFTNVGKDGISLEEVFEQYDDRAIKTLIEDYINNANERFKNLYVIDRNGRKHMVKIFNKDLGRNFTVTDLLYIAAIDITEDKHVVYTRYPVENNQSVAPAKIKVLSTIETIPSQKIEDRILEDYPMILKDYPEVERMFVDSTLISNSYTSALGADYDGDMISIRGIWTQEANNEADRLVNAKTNILNYTGNSTRKVSNEAVLSLHILTK